MQHLKSIWQDRPPSSDNLWIFFFLSFIQKLLTNKVRWGSLYSWKNSKTNWWNHYWKWLNTVKSLTVKYCIWLGHPAAEVGRSLTHTVPHTQTWDERDVWVCLGGIQKMRLSFHEQLVGWSILSSCLCGTPSPCWFKFCPHMNNGSVGHFVQRTVKTRLYTLLSCTPMTHILTWPMIKFYRHKPKPPWQIRKTLREIFLTTESMFLGQYFSYSLLSTFM